MNMRMLSCLALIFSVLYLVPSAFAGTEFTIPDPYDPVRRLPLDLQGRIVCDSAHLNGIVQADCVKARDFYLEQFGKTDLRFSTMADNIRPNPKAIVGAFLTTRGIECQKNDHATIMACGIAKKVFASMSEEDRQMMIAERKENIMPLLIVPLSGELNCSWSKLGREQYQVCLKQNEFVGHMLFEERLKHNNQAFTLLSLIEQMDQMNKRCKCNK